MKAVNLLLVCLLATMVCAQRRECKQVTYDHIILALTWPNEFCSQKDCVAGWQNQWDKKSFTIHGFWPSSSDLSYLSCFAEHKYDPYCFVDYKFSEDQFSQQELKDLNKYWPAIGPMKDFWGYEWDKHGTCYLHILKNIQKSNLTNQQIFREYFLSTVDRVADLKLQLKPGTIKTKEELAIKLNLKANQFYAICGKDNELDEIRICYDIYSEPGLQQIMTCPKSTDRSQCKFPTIIR